MLKLNSISLVQFKNYHEAAFNFEARVVGICGRNGKGKTNLLDAVYYLCFTKSYFTRSEIQNVTTGTEGFRLQGNFELDGHPIDVISILRDTGKKEFLVDGQPYLKLSEHIGRLPTVIIAPDDVQIITGGSEDRRRFLDSLLSQLDHSYLLQLINYNKILQQRNSLLKSFAETRRMDNNLLEVLNEQLARPGREIFEKRKLFLNQFLILVQEFYKKISGEYYDVGISYESQLSHADFETLFHQFRDKDFALQRTNAGVHRDDLHITLNQSAFKSIASQGQRKSLLFALKLAEFETLKKSKGYSPLLLLDDVFEKLDEGRMKNLLDWVCHSNNGQIFITDTHCQRLTEHLNELNIQHQLINL